MNHVFTRSLLCLFFTALATISALTAGTNQITHEDLWLLKRVGPPEPSPDGRWVVMPVTEPAYDEKEERSNLWIVPADGSAPPRRLTTGKGRESAPAWSPDGSRLAFVTKREGDDAAQVYILNLAGGEARRASQSTHGARKPLWSPDGKAILYQASSYAGATGDTENRRILEERKKAKSKVRVYESFPIRRWDKWLDDLQTHLFVMNPDAPGEARDLLAGTRLVASAGFRGTGDDGSTDTLQPVWAPDSKSVVFVATSRFNTSAYDQPAFNLYRISLEEKEPVQLTENGINATQPAFTPDGRKLFFVINRTLGTNYYSLEKLASASWPWKGTVDEVPVNFDRSVESFDFSGDGKTLFLTAEDAGHVRVWSLPAVGGNPAPIVKNKQGCWSGIKTVKSGKQTRIFANWGAAHRPQEVHRIDYPAGTQASLTDFNGNKLEKLDLAPLSEFWMTNRVGMALHSQMLLPPGFDSTRKYPLLVFIHGGHALMNKDLMSIRWNLHLLARPGYVVLLTDYRGSTGYGEKFTTSILGDPLRGPAEDLLEAADEAIRRFSFIDGTRQAAAGASYGGHLVNWLEGTTSRFRCLVGHAGLASLHSQWATSDSVYHRELMMGSASWRGQKAWMENSPSSHAASFRTPMLLSIGEDDFRVPLNNTLEMWTLLQRQQIPSRLLVWPDENHWILKAENSRRFYQEVHQWLNRWLSEKTN